MDSVTGIDIATVRGRRRRRRGKERREKERKRGKVDYLDVITASKVFKDNE